MDSLLHGLNDHAVTLADSAWGLVLVFACAAVDALVPMVPSESVVVALAAISMSTGDPNLALLLLAAAGGAFLGDNTTYRIGQRIGLTRFAWMRRPKMQAAFAGARRELDKRSALLILTARYIPVGRVVVNLTAGASGFPAARFVPLSVVGALTWAGYAVLVGVLAGQWVQENPLLGAVVAVSVAAVLGLLVDRGLTWWRARRA